MKVFISWSGEPSRSIARALDGWLESVVQHVDAWMSDEEIRSGDRWNREIANALDEINFGIICVTKSNQAAPWLLFEAGALAKSVTKGRIVPLCINLYPSDITGPLADFQSRRLDEADMKRLTHDLNDASETPMKKERLDAIFSAMWPRLEAEVAAAVHSTIMNEKPHPPEFGYGQ